MKKIVLPVIAVIVTLAGIAGYFKYQKPPESNLKAPEIKKEITPSETSIEYTDPSGFSFNYPDNLSITNNNSSENPDPNAYADLQLFSKDKNGSLSLKIVDTKLKNLDEWLKSNNSSSTSAIEKKFGQMNALEIKTADHLILGSIDQGVLFTIEMPLIEQPFWNSVYKKVLADFNFAAPDTANQSSTTVAAGDEVVFEGEEVVE